jgi:hypothetical protein
MPDTPNNQFIITVTVPEGANLPAVAIHPAITDVVKGALEEFFKSHPLGGASTSLGVDCCPQTNK